MDNPSIKYGVYVGVGASVLYLLLYFISAELLMGWQIGLVVGIATIYFMVQAVNEYRDEHEEGLISFKDAFKAAWLTYIIVTVIQMFTTYVIYNILDPNLIDMVLEKSIEAIESMSGILGEEGVEKAVEAIEDTNPFSLSKIIQSTLMSFVMGAIIAAIIAAVKKKNPSPFA